MGHATWQESFAMGHSEIDHCHRSLIQGLSATYRAVIAHNYERARRLADNLYDISSIHSQAELDVFDDHEHIPHEVIDDIILRIKALIDNRVHSAQIIDSIRHLERVLLADILSEKKAFVASAAAA